MKKSVSLFLIIALTSGFFWGCQKKGNPPTLPPSGSMTIDFSDFSAGKKSAKAVENTNWTVAATVAGVWNSILIINLAVPVAAFEKAISYKPANLDKKTWQWKYDFNVVGATYHARLTGQIGATDVVWNMYISKDGVGSFSEFLWYTGTVLSDGNSGTWTINEGPGNQAPLIQIDWTKTGGAVATVKYTYVKTGAFKDSYIEYGLTENTLNGYYNIHAWDANKIKFVDVNIEWSTSNHNGHIKAIDYFQDSNWHCWDQNGNDIQCPPK